MGDGDNRRQRAAGERGMAGREEEGKLDQPAVFGGFRLS